MGEPLDSQNAVRQILQISGSDAESYADLM